jgi:GNAT superfamily N-acetyltransferase
VSPAGFALREVRESDAGAIVGLVHACFEEYREFAQAGWEPPSDEGARGRMEVGLARATTGGFVAVAGPEHAGHVLWIPAAESERLASDDPRLGYLWQLFLSPAHRGSGLGAELMAAAVQAATGEGYAELRLLTPKDHARARRFYEREAWSPLGDWGVDPDLRLPIVEYGRRLDG